jgi:L-methionine (R)-S-oxide reductase
MFFKILNFNKNIIFTFLLMYNFTKKLKMEFELIKTEVKNIIRTNENRDEKLSNICQLLQDSISYYNWVGFYFANHETKTLHLGPYVGAETDHTVIPFGKGICGQVAESNANFVVPDVSAQDNYIACSFTVKSEIVVPLFVNGINIGQIDIDSHVIDPFTEADERFLEFVNEQVALLF